jgi:hypothetical protein
MVFAAVLSLVDMRRRRSAGEPRHLGEHYPIRRCGGGMGGAVRRPRQQDPGGVGCGRTGQEVELAVGRADDEAFCPRLEKAETDCCQLLGASSSPHAREHLIQHPHLTTINF